MSGEMAGRMVPTDADAGVVTASAAQVAMVGAGRPHGIGRVLAACALSALLAGCAGGGVGGGATTGNTGFFGLQNPFAGMQNGVDPDLRGRIGGSLDTSGAAGGGAAGGAPAAGTGGVVDPFAGQGVSQPQIEPASGTRASGASTPTPAAPSASGTSTTNTASAAPAGRPATTAPSATATAATSHRVAAGETAWSISRRYGVSVAALAAANGLPEGMTVRVGQTLAIPAGTRQAGAAPVTQPGAGSPTPEPPSASKPLPREATAPAGAPVAKPSGPDLGATRTAASGGNGKFRMPVSGSIVRAYAKGRNEGIDISAPTGTSVKAAGSGTVAAVTRDTQGVPIVVVRHEGSLMTVYSGLDNLTIAKGDKVTAGEAIGKSSTAGVLHFEVRQGFESVDPETYLR